MAFIVGRGFHGLLALFPMVVGVSIGLAIARPRSIRSLLPTATLTLAVIALAVLVAWRPLRRRCWGRTRNRCRAVWPS